MSAAKGVTHTLTLEILDKLIESNGGSIISFDFNDPAKFQLSSLDRIELIGGGVAKERKKVTSFYLNQNHLTSLAKLTGTKHFALFPQVQ